MHDEWLSTPSPFAKATLYYPLVGGFDPCDANYYFERDNYPAYEILLITQGKGAFRHGTAWMRFGPGDCLLHNMRYPHAYKADLEDPCQLLYLVFDGSELENLWPRLFGGPVSLFPAFGAAPGAASASVVRMLRSVLDGMRTTVPHLEWEQSSSIYGLLMECARLADRDGAVLPVPSGIEQALRYVDANYLTIGSIKEIAREAGLSVYHFIRQFKKHYGFTPKEYMLQKRINHAKRLLMLTDAAVGEVAEQCGFESYNAFLHTFRNAERCSPSAFRKNWKRG
ncbi:AraC family transcriptional regulator [Paenibacillus sp. R14(2021)]|uniref:helix-turn-helix transcriptional regulator n=1 Tax=Paenibacillus sp. R14(2021) TaxID=2859228 RepID=UPI001C613CB4|nr:AraC family transcriptional regulator [Paenibacillus sp. R14(2021)]